MRSHDLTGSRLINELGREKVYAMYEYMDLLWETSAFVPCPTNLIASMFQTTPTHVTYVMLAWRTSRTKEEKRVIEGQNHVEVMPSADLAMNRGLPQSYGRRR